MLHVSIHDKMQMNIKNQVLFLEPLLDLLQPIIWTCRYQELIPKTVFEKHDAGHPIYSILKILFRKALLWNRTLQQTLCKFVIWSEFCSQHTIHCIAVLVQGYVTILLYCVYCLYGFLFIQLLRHIVMTMLSLWDDSTVTLTNCSLWMNFIQWRSNGRIAFIAATLVDPSMAGINNTMTVFLTATGRYADRSSLLHLVRWGSLFVAIYHQTGFFTGQWAVEA